MIKYGLLGYPLTHSFSGQYFKKKFKDEGIRDVEYNLYPLEKIELLPDLLSKEPDITGLNVTIPFKEQVVPLLTDIDDEAKIIGAVNTIKIFRKADSIFLKGFNTDVYGFIQSLMPLLKPWHQKALILGTGGTSKAVIYVLNRLGIEWMFVSRKPASEKEISYQEVSQPLINEHHLIINTTPIGMYPNTSEFPPFPYEWLTPEHLLYDFIYNPEKTQFLLRGEAMHTETKNGMEMLTIQAEKSWEIWNNPNE